MQKFISILLIILVSFGMVFSDAHAKRFGGGRSFGMSRSTSSYSSARSNAMPAQNAAAPRGNRWMGPLAGMALGGILASLFMGNGLASGMMSWLLVGGIFLLLINLFRSFSQNRTQSNQARQTYQMFGDKSAQQQAPLASSLNYAGNNYQPTYPAGFNEMEFLRDAKVQFIRLQAAYDQSNLQDLGQFTTPEVFAEVKMQLQERGDQRNQTDVVSLNAELVDMTLEFQEWVASVKFSGSIKEDIDQIAAPFTEVWHFRKNQNGNWLTAGIQQH
jgi:predicted lipid-binding transport protein (Tim44 family)